MSASILRSLSKISYQVYQRTSGAKSFDTCPFNELRDRFRLFTFADQLHSLNGHLKPICSVRMLANCFVKDHCYKCDVRTGSGERYWSSLDCMQSIAGFGQQTCQQTCQLAGHLNGYYLQFHVRLNINLRSKSAHLRSRLEWRLSIGRNRKFKQMPLGNRSSVTAFRWHLKFLSFIDTIDTVCLKWVGEEIS